jgi:hypothetical protein
MMMRLAGRQTILPPPPSLALALRAFATAWWFRAGVFVRAQREALRHQAPAKPAAAPATLLALPASSSVPCLVTLEMLRPTRPFDHAGLRRSAVTVARAG